MLLGGGIDRAHRILDREQPDLRMARHQAFERVLVADVGGDAVQHDGPRLQRADHRVGVRIGEDVEPLLVEQDVALVLAEPPGERRGIRGRRLDDERIPQRGLGNLLLSRRAVHAVLGERLAEVGLVGELAVTLHVIVGAGHDADPVAVGVVGQPLEIGNDALGAGDVQLAVGPHEVMLGIDIPEYD